VTLDPFDRDDTAPNDGSPALRALVRSTPREAPTSAAIARMATHLVAAGAIEQPVPSPTSHVTSRRSHHALGALGLAIVVGGVAGTWLSSASSLPAAEVALSSPAPPEATSFTERVLPNAPTTAPSAAEPVVSVDDLPSTPATSLAGTARVSSRTTGELPNARRGATVASPALAPSSAAPFRSPSQEPAAIAVSELELMRRAEESFPAHPERTLALAAEHARAYPEGQFVQEREVLAVEALARLGRRDEATRRALAVVERFPRTPYAARLELATNQPLMRSRPSLLRP